MTWKVTSKGTLYKKLKNGKYKKIKGKVKIGYGGSKGPDY